MASKTKKPISPKKKKLTKNSKDKILFGVIGGIADYSNQDPTLLRIIWLILVAFTGFVPGIIAYIAAIFVMPTK